MSKPVNSSLLSKIPSVNLLLDLLKPQFPGLSEIVLKGFVQHVLFSVRKAPGKFGLHKLDKDQLQQRLAGHIKKELEDLLNGSLKPVVNATGVVLHTGLGRAPLSPVLVSALQNISRFTNLEFNLASGKRGQRNDHVNLLLRLLTGAEDGLAVNNNAAAVMLMLNSVARRREVILSRGEMIEIGGSFRLPEVMKMSGCKLREIGTTNKTHLHDYEAAITEKTAAIMICHPSNYEVQGFTAKPSVQDIVRLAERHQLPIIYDLGSGSLIKTELFGSDSEPEVRQIVEAGVDLISFSGDKLLGGPQAGLIVGKREWVQRCAKNQMLRALRLDKIMLKLLQATLLNYCFSDRIEQGIPAIEMLTAHPDRIAARAERLVKKLQKPLRNQVQVAKSQARVGSGAFPNMPLESSALCILPEKISVQNLAAKLRKQALPILSYINENRLYLDLRTVFEDQEDYLAEVLSRLLA